MHSSIFFGKPEHIPEYRNPRFEKFIKFMGEFANVMLMMCATCAIWHVGTSLAAYLCMILYHLVQRMRIHMIYFYDNKGLGPQWKETLMEDIAYSLRYGLVNIGMAWIFFLTYELIGKLLRWIPTLFS